MLKRNDLRGDEGGVSIVRRLLNRYCTQHPAHVHSHELCLSRFSGLMPPEICKIKSYRVISTKKKKKYERSGTRTHADLST